MAARRKIMRKLLKLWRTLMKKQSAPLGHMCAHTRIKMPHWLFSAENKKTLSSKWAELSFIRRRQLDAATAWRMKDSEGLFFTLAPLNCFSLNRGSAAYRFFVFSGHPWGCSHIRCAVFIFHILSLGWTKRLPEFFSKRAPVPWRQWSGQTECFWQGGGEEKEIIRLRILINSLLGEKKKWNSLSMDKIPLPVEFSFQA